jgi:hypothetical protein
VFEFPIARGDSLHPAHACTTMSEAVAFGTVNRHTVELGAHHAHTHMYQPCRADRKYHTRGVRHHIEPCVLYTACKRAGFCDASQIAGSSLTRAARGCSCQNWGYIVHVYKDDDVGVSECSGSCPRADVRWSPRSCRLGSNRGFRWLSRKNFHQGGEHLHPTFTTVHRFVCTPLQIPPFYYWTRH